MRESQGLGEFAGGWRWYEIGRSTTGLVRRLLALRKAASEFRGGAHYFYNDWARYQSRGLVLFSRYEGGRFSLVALNFSDTEQTVPFWFPMAGSYEEQLHHRPEDRLNGVVALTEQWVNIPGNYGRVWSRP